eukprot:2327695-Pyramimonas_sp.AAC.1
MRTSTDSYRALVLLGWARYSLSFPRVPPSPLTTLTLRCQVQHRRSLTCPPYRSRAFPMGLPSLLAAMPASPS